MPKAPITNITFGTMTLGYRGYGARVHDAATADAMLGAVLEFGHDQLDTCSVYGDGTCEQMLGDLRAAERFGIATRIHSGKQGMYNAITHAVEPELFKCLDNYGIRFHAYNPLAGGAFNKNFASSAAVAAGSRFDSSTAQGKFYRDRYWNDAYFDALAEIHRSCEGHGL